MATPKEELAKKENLLGAYLDSVLVSIETENTLISDISGGITGLFDSLNKIGELNKQEFLQYRVEFQESFLNPLKKMDDHRAQLVFVHDQIKELQIKIGNAKMDNQPFHQKCHETLLQNLVLPLKDQLTELVRLENEVGTLKKTEPTTDALAIEQAQTTAKKISSVENELIETREVAQEIYIPLNLVDKPLESKTGKPLNNAKYVAKGRKFAWSDERIPNIVAIFLLEQGWIFDYQFKTVQDFF